MTLDQAIIHKTYRVAEVGGDEAQRRQLTALGLTDGVAVTCVLKAPTGDPIAFAVRGAVLALRRDQLRAVRAVQEG